MKKRLMRLKLKNILSFALAITTVATSLPISTVTTVAADENTESVSANTVSTTDLYTADDNSVSLNDIDNDIDAELFTAKSTGKQINSYKIEKSGGYSDAIYAHNGYICGSYVVNVSSSQSFISPYKVEDGYYVWFDGSKEKVDDYSDVCIGTPLPLKDIKDVIRNYSSFYTVNGGDSIEYQTYDNGYKIYRQNRGSSEAYLVRELSDCTLCVISGYEHGSYSLVCRNMHSEEAPNNLKAELYYDIDGDEHVEDLGIITTYSGNILATAMKDGYFYYVNKETGKIVKHKLGTNSTDTDETIDLPDGTASRFYSSGSSLVLVKGTDKMVLSTSEAQYCYKRYIVDFNEKTVEETDSRYVMTLNPSETILTFTDSNNYNSDYNTGIYKIPYRTLSAEGISETKIFDGVTYSDVLTLNDIDNVDDSVVTYGSSAGMYYMYLKDDYKDFNLVEPFDYTYKKGNNQNFQLRFIVSTDSSISDKRMYIYNTNKPLLSGPYDRNGNFDYDKASMFSGVDDDCENGIYIEYLTGNKELIPGVKSHQKKSYSSHTEPATCSEHSKTYYDCALCNKKDVAYDEGTWYNYDAHTSFYDERNILKLPTCTEDGERGLKCFDCGRNVYDTEEEFNPKSSYTGRTHVRNTNGTLQPDLYYYQLTAIKANGHKLVHSVVKEPTCKEKGIIKLTCENCDYSGESYIDAKGHNMKITKIIEEPTCDSYGYGKAICEDCGYTVKRYRIDKLDHDYSLIDEETDKDVVIRYYECNNCGHEYTKTLKTKDISENCMYFQHLYTSDNDGKGRVEPTFYSKDNSISQLNSLSNYWYNDTDDNINFEMSTTNQQIKSLSKDAYSLVKINGQNITDFLNIDSSVEPTVLSTDVFDREYNYGIYYTLSEGLGAWAIPDISYQRVIDDDVTIKLTGDDSYFKDLLEKREVIYTLVNIRDTKQSKLYIKDSIKYQNNSAYIADEGGFYIVDSPLDNDSDQGYFYDRTCDYKLYKLSSNSDTLDFTATEENFITVAPNTDNYYLIEAIPNTTIKDLVDKTADTLISEWNNQGKPEGFIEYKFGELARKTLAYGFNFVSDLTLPDRSDDVTADDINSLINTEYVTPIETVTSEDGKLSIDVVSNIKLPDDKYFDTFVGIANTAEPDGYENKIVTSDVKGTYALYKQKATLEPSSNSADYFNDSYENSSNTIDVPVNDWLFKEPVLSWSIVNDDGTETPVQNNQVIDNIKYFVGDTSIRAETTKNLDDELEISVKCTIHDNATNSEKYHDGALKFKNLDAELDIDTDNLGDATIIGNTITVTKGKQISLTATPKYIKSDNGDEVETDESVKWYFRTADGKLYDINNITGDMTESSDDISYITDEIDLNTTDLRETKSESNDNFIKKLTNKVVDLFTIDVNAATQSTVKVTPSTNGSLIAVFNGRYGSTYNVLAVNIGNEPVAPVPVKIDAKYVGPDIVIGKDYNKSAVTVTITYSDNSTKTLRDDEWEEDSLTVKNVGKNTFKASYDSLETTFEITGKKIINSIKAIYNGEPVGVGKEYNKSDVEVRIVYNDSSESDPLDESSWKESSLLVSKVDKNTFIATYKDFTTTYDIIGKAELSSISAKYVGEPVGIGEKYSKSDVEVIAKYTDGSEKRLDDDEWTASSLKVTKEGKNSFTATFNDFKTDYDITGLLLINKITAKYKGSDVEVGKNYNKDDVEVTAYYNDGTKEKIDSDDWKESGLKVEKVGINKFKAKYDDKEAQFKITGMQIVDVPGPVPPIIVHTGVDTLIPLLITLIVIAFALSGYLVVKRKENK